MKIFKNKLRRLIRESLLLEMFKNLKPYTFSKKPLIINVGSLYPTTIGSEYNFVTDSGLNYSVSFTHIDNKGDIRMPDDVNAVFNLGKNMYWDISFTTAEKGHELTNQNDIKVLHTIIATVKDFVQNVLPNFEDSAFRETRVFVSECNSEHNGDDRRAKVYQYMLKKQGITNSEIAEVSRTSYNHRLREPYEKLAYFIKFEV